MLRACDKHDNHADAGGGYAAAAVCQVVTCKLVAAVAEHSACDTYHNYHNYAAAGGGYVLLSSDCSLPSGRFVALAELLNTAPLDQVP